jgi:hypothetical protein
MSFRKVFDEEGVTTEPQEYVLKFSYPKNVGNTTLSVLRRLPFLAHRSKV